MHVATVTCRFDPALGAIDDGPLRLFGRDKVVLSVRDHFFVHGEVPHLVFVVVYRLVAPSRPDGSSGRLDARAHEAGARSPESGRSAPSTDDLRAGLPPDVRARFDLLRDWRNRMAQDEAVPAYAVLTNKQLLQLAREAPTTRAGVERVQGLGRKKADRYAPAILAITAGQAGPATNGPATNGPATSGLIDGRLGAPATPGPGPAGPAPKPSSAAGPAPAPAGTNPAPDDLPWAPVAPPAAAPVVTPPAGPAGAPASPAEESAS
ncbi:MAG: HRDC domain-containing protein [Planctomycetes bacterium]|nr:HRDC domain-containing protein [Planctomycetota bacterium]